VRKFTLKNDGEYGNAKSGETVYEFLGNTFGVIATGVAVSRVKDEYPFFEVSRDNLTEVFEIPEGENDGSIAPSTGETEAG